LLSLPPLFIGFRRDGTFLDFTPRD